MSWQGTRLTTRHLAGLPALDRPLVMGVVNVTPDSFSDGGRWFDPEAAIEHGLELLEDGADLLDIGGESTRPGATRPVVAEELDRVLPVITALTSEGATVSVDTMRGEVAEAALDAGAVVVNDVSGGLADPRILSVVADAGASYVAMHWRAHADTMQQHASYDDVVSDVVTELGQRVEAARGSASRRPTSTTGRCCAGSTPSTQSAHRCWWARAASRSSVRCSPTATEGHGRCSTARRPTRR
jgi:dihydropteroate synthase